MLARDLLSLQEQEYALALAADTRAEEELRRSIEATLVEAAREEDARAVDAEEEEEDAVVLTLEQLREARLRALMPHVDRRPRPRGLLAGIDAGNIVSTPRIRRSARIQVRAGTNTSR